ncbi:DsbE family thiol:disulfide interchange protein [Croceicoccus sp. YJ47]|uniref:DsbE family thiol:disulfide interchange protein n=1 Tax=Croceicoccus sp. YJ47 TaxID=2798724 RepID=UPI001920538B|nr:DsbE family thiol:disulfide interchange protein [Croceicoccus sp. YJ47]QQN73696.1 DsbE family thiol:disulfide interchange protein [Croceicoccus sp. YJ47]
MSAPTPGRRSRWTIWLPLALFIGFVALVAYGLMAPGERDVRSAMVGNPLPQFTLPAGVEGTPGLSRAGFTKGEPRLLNIFASWCVPCAVEAPQLDTLAAQGVPIDGVAIRDRSEDIAQFLERNGNPYRAIGKDDVSAVQLGIGSSGVPETFVIDGDGIIRYQHMGPIMERDIAQIMSEWRKAKEPL